MTAFLEQTAGYLLSEYGDRIPDLCIVLPNLRAGLFLRKYLGAALGKTTWAPVICSADDFMTRVAGLRSADPTQVLFRLYLIHRETEKEKARSLEDFLNWAPQLMDDFDEADRCLADMRQLFSALSDARAITVWNPDHREPTDFQKQYLNFYRSLYPYYVKLVDGLLGENLAYPGLMYRMAAMGAERFCTEMPWEKVVFAGFNALCPAEEKVMDTLLKEGRAEFLWDADRYYLDDRNQEAGEFMRRNRKKWGGKEFRWIGDQLASRPKSISISGVPSNVSQAALAADIVSSLGSCDERTAIVLQDEALLIPLLYALPQGSGEMNITMGLPLLQTPVNSLMELVFKMHLNRESFTANRRKGEKLFYFRDILALLRHPYLSSMAAGIMEGSRFVYEDILRNLAGGQKVFLSSEEIIPQAQGLFAANADFLQPFFADWSAPGDALEHLRQVISHLRDHFIQKDAGVELEFLFALSRLTFQLDNLLASFPGIIANLQNLRDIFLKLLSRLTLPFYGEPLKGMQIMGMHETRALDFDHIIMLSCNENLLPRGRSANSFIPLDLRLEFGMQTYRQKDAISAYQFYRLFQSASSISLVYSTETGDFGAGEMSRFLQQIISEFPGACPGATINREMVTMPVPSTRRPGEISIEKTAEIMRLLRAKAEKGISPTALINFRSCGLKFYLSDLALLKEPEEMEEEIDNRILGNIVHDALFRLYKGWSGKILSMEVLEQMRSGITAAVEEACSKEFGGRDVSVGRNNLLVRVAKTMIRRFLDSEKDYLHELADEGASLNLLELETWLRRRLEVGGAGEGLSVLIAGKADRIDSDGRVVRLIDYKTGSSQQSRAKVDDWEKFRIDSKKDHAFQLLAYAWLYQPRLKNNMPVEAGIMSLRKVKDGIISVVVPSQEPKQFHSALDASDLKEFESGLALLVSDIFDATAPFTQTTDPDICKKCRYIDVCGRG